MDNTQAALMWLAMIVVMSVLSWKHNSDHLKTLEYIERLQKSVIQLQDLALKPPCGVAWWATDQAWVYHEAKPGTVIVNTFDPCPTDQETTR